MEREHGKLIVDRDICTGCRSCEVACSLAHEGVFWPEKSRIQVNKQEEEGLDYPLVCRQCEDPPCIDACPEKALERDGCTGAVLVNNECIGCGACVDACPYGAVRLDPERERAVICDLCRGEPACVQRCVVHALKYRDATGRIITAPAHAVTLPCDKMKKS